MNNLKPCPYRQADNDGHILCDKIKSGDREVAPNICRACPVSAINCAHLRATLDHQARPPITVRYGNGKTEVWDDPAPTISLERAACAAKVVPIHSARDCAGCALRQALIGVDAVQMPDRSTDSAPSRRRQPVAPRVPRPVPTPALVAQAAQPQPVAQTSQPAPVADARSTIVHQKIIQLQEWLAKQKNVKEEEEDNAVRPIAVGERRAVRVREEKRVGWTD
ncbi:hypothetical protein ANRL1_04388 [Anaerolineae bacterium]|nr:hypothetical protein ANRL1_04388 [Anaerolineae bacterium]